MPVCTLRAVQRQPNGAARPGQGDRCIMQQVASCRWHCALESRMEIPRMVPAMQNRRRDARDRGISSLRCALVRVNAERAR